MEANGAYILWGGCGAVGPMNDGGIFTGIWQAVESDDAPAARSNHSAVWTGSEMLIFGGSGSGVLGDCHAYRPSRKLHIYQRP